MTGELAARHVRKTMDAGKGARFADLLPSFLLTLSERDVSPRMLEVYKGTDAQFAKYLADNGLPEDTEGIDAPHIRASRRAETALHGAVLAGGLELAGT